MYLRTLYLCYVEFRIEIMATGETRKKEKALSTARSFGKGKIISKQHKHIAKSPWK